MDDMLGKKHPITAPSKTPAGMPKSVPIVFILVIGIVTLSHGLSTRVVTIFLIASALMLMAYYFESRPRDQPPSRA